MKAIFYTCVTVVFIISSCDTPKEENMNNKNELVQKSDDELLNSLVLSYYLALVRDIESISENGVSISIRDFFRLRHDEFEMASEFGSLNYRYVNLVSKKFPIIKIETLYAQEDVSVPRADARENMIDIAVCVKFGPGDNDISRLLIVSKSKLLSPVVFGDS